MGKVLIFDHNARERQRSADFLARAQTDFNAAFAGAREEFRLAKEESDPEKRMAAFLGVEKRLERLDADHKTIVNANKRLTGQLRDELAVRWNRIEGLLAYGIACGMSSSADKFICSVLKEARETRNIEERERLWAEADLALPAAISAAEAGYNTVNIPNTDQHG